MYYQNNLPKNDNPISEANSALAEIAVKSGWGKHSLITYNAGIFEDQKRSKVGILVFPGLSYADEPVQFGFYDCDANDDLGTRDAEWTGKLSDSAGKYFGQSVLSSNEENPKILTAESVERLPEFIQYVSEQFGLKRVS